LFSIFESTNEGDSSQRRGGKSVGTYLSPEEPELGYLRRNLISRLVK